MIAGYRKEVILGVGPLGGLGDHLLYSTLARRFSTEGHEVYLHEDVMARNDEILDLLYYCNPFIKGVKSRLTPSAGYVKQGAFYDQLNALPLGCAVEAMERVHGFGPPYSLNPQIHYRPKPYKIDLSQVVLMDMHALSSSISNEGWQMFHTKMVDRFGGKAICLLTFSAGIAPPLPIPPGVPTLTPASLFEYCDMIAGCRAWIGSEAGGQALAAAVRGEHDVFSLGIRPEIVCLMAPNTFNSRAFCFRGVDYRTSKAAAGGDYLDPVEVPYHRYHAICRVNIAAKANEWRVERGVAERGLWSVEPVTVGEKAEFGKRGQAKDRAVDHNIFLNRPESET